VYTAYSCYNMSFTSDKPIANIINLAATGSQPVDTKMDCDIPAIPGTSRGNSGRVASGSTAPAIAVTAAGGSGIQQEGMAGTAGANSAYKNLQQGAGAAPSKKSVMYEEIMVQRRIKGEHAALGLGPGADMFTCGVSSPWRTTSDISRPASGKTKMISSSAPPASRERTGCVPAVTRGMPYYP
jgi:hypothetical protein